MTDLSNNLTNDLTNKVAVVTGALGAIGSRISAELAKRGATVVLVVREEARGRAAAEGLAAATKNANVEVQVCDLGSLASVRAAAAAIVKRHPKIDVLINNAAVFAGERRTTQDGFELMMGVNHLGPFLFTNLLLPALEAAAPSRIVFMTMDNKAKIALDDLQSEKKFSPMGSFGASKAAPAFVARELAERLAGKGVSVNVINPGMTKTTLVKDAPLPIRIVFALFAKSEAKGAAAPVHVATSRELAGVTGKFFDGSKMVPFPKPIEDAALRAQLWTKSAELVGLS